MSLPEPHRLEQIARQRAESLQLDAAAVACFEDDGVVRSEYSRGRAAAFTCDTPVRAACVAKLVTATLAFDAALAGRLDVRAPLDEYLREMLQAKCVANFHGLTLRHLFDHTHGLDGADVEEAPRDPSGYIDLADLCERLFGRPTLHEPGRFFSYGHAGYVILGGILERIYEAPFSQVLELYLLRVLGIDSRISTTVCPSTGGGLCLSVADALKVLNHYWKIMDALPLANGVNGVAVLLSDVRSLPGYNWTDTGYTWGWRHQPNEWLCWIGTSIGGEALVLKVNPRKRRGLVVSGKNARIKSFADHLASDIWNLPFSVASPGESATAAACTDDVNEYVGTYADSSTTITVTRADERLSMTVRRSSPTALQKTTRTLQSLRRAAPHLFFCMPPDRTHFYFAQFLFTGDSPGAGHSWNGMRLWPRRP